MGPSSESHHKEAVLRLIRPCPYPEWLLLELPNGMWGALWYAGFEADHCIAIADGHYRDACAYRSREKGRVLNYMAKNRLV
jgi:hypothetical protein